MVKGKSPTCARCGGIGHNTRTCKNEPKQKPREPLRPELRDSTGKFLKGTRGNPGGWDKEAKKAKRKISDIIRGKIEIGETNIVVDRMVDLVVDGEPGEAIPAGKLLMEYAYGRPKQQVEVKGALEVVHEARESVNGTIAGIAARIRADTDPGGSDG